MTYSIAALDRETGELGVAVQSRAFASGSAVPWVDPRVGAVASQAFAARSYGPLGLELLRRGRTPERALAALVADDDQADVRQVAIVDAAGRTAVHTGTGCIPDAGHVAGDGFTAQANCCRGAVWEAMADSFVSGRGTLAQRLLSALEAAEAAGGDFRGRQAAALLVRDPDGEPWDRVSDIRVDDHPDPLGELRRLLTLEEGYRRLNRAESQRAAVAREAGLPELDVHMAEVFDAASAGDLERARELVRPLVQAEPRWRALILTLGDRGVLANAAELVEEI